MREEVEREGFIGGGDGVEVGGDGDEDGRGEWAGEQMEEGDKKEEGASVKV